MVALLLHPVDQIRDMAALLLYAASSVERFVGDELPSDGGDVRIQLHKLKSANTRKRKSNLVEHVKKVLEIIPPKGKEFPEHNLEWEKNLVWWKRDGCLAFERPPFEKKPVKGRARKWLWEILLWVRSKEHSILMLQVHYTKLR